jgi:hypothetical protein
VPAQLPRNDRRVPAFTPAPPSILTFIKSTDGGPALSAWGWVVRNSNEQPFFVSATLGGTAALQAAAKGAAKVAAEPTTPMNVARRG